MRREIGREAKERRWRVGWKGEKGGRNVKRGRERGRREEGRRGKISAGRIEAGGREGEIK